MPILYLQTDKPKTKDLRCAVDGCENICRVTVFFAPAKARCPDCGGPEALDEQEVEGMPEPREQEKPRVTLDIPEQGQGALQTLHCPFDLTPMEPLAIRESSGHLEMGCPQCDLVLTFWMRWRTLQVKRIPKAWVPIVEALSKAQNEFDRTAWGRQ